MSCSSDNFHVKLKTRYQTETLQLVYDLPVRSYNRHS